MPAYADNYLDITSTNAIVTLECDEVIPRPVQLQNFSADQSVSVEDIEIAEGRMGVDGGFAAGYKPTAYSLNITLEANSPSTQYLTSILTASRANRRTYRCRIIVHLNTTGKRYIYSNGTMTKGKVMSDLKKTMEPTSWTFVFAKFEQESI